MTNTKTSLILGFCTFRCWDCIFRKNKLVSSTFRLWDCIFRKNKLVFDPIDPFPVAKNANFYEKYQNVSNPWFLAHLDFGIAYLGKIC